MWPLFLTFTIGEASSLFDMDSPSSDSYQSSKQWEQKSMRFECDHPAVRPKKQPTLLQSEHVRQKKVVKCSYPAQAC
jgi:hypothetical protein